MENARRAVITGVTGQDGAYLADLLLRKGYRVFGTYRRTSSINFWRLEELDITDHPYLSLLEYDLTDLSSTIRLLEKAEPHEVYNLAAQSYVGVSFEQPITTAEITGIGALNLLEAVRIVDPSIRFYQASTSEMFGKAQAVPQNESTAFYPRSPYGVAKLFAHWSTLNYQEAYGIHASSGILFNHESPLRGKEFVTRKISNAAAKISLGLQTTLELGNLEAKRDWGYAKEYVEGMWKMLQAESPGVFVLATGKSHSVRDFVKLAFAKAGITLSFEGTGTAELGLNIETGEEVVRVNPSYFRPAEVDLLLGDANLAADRLGWNPTTELEELCEIMVVADLKRYSTY